MRYFLFIVGVLFMVGCSRYGDGKKKVNINNKDIEVYVIDSCEYIGSVWGSYSDFLTHKGNCKFCTERNKPRSGWPNGSAAYSLPIDKDGNWIEDTVKPTGKIQLHYY